MRKNSWIVVRALRLSIVGLTLFAFAGCQSTQGPDWKQQIALALDHFNKGEEELKKNNIEAAEKEYLSSLEISPRPITYVRLSQIKSNRNDIRGALADLDKALKLAPNFQRAIVYKKQVQLRFQDSENKPEGEIAPQTSEVKKTEEPIQSELIQPAVPSKPEEPKPIESKPVDVKAVETKAVETTSTEPVSEPKAATHEPEKPKQPEAVPVESKPAQSEILKAESIPSENESLLREAREAFDKGDWAGAQAKYKVILEKNPKSAIVQYNYGYTCIQQNQLEEAQAAFARTVELDPKNSDAYNDLGVTLEKLNRSGEAVTAYQKAVEIGGNTDAFFNLALLKEKQGLYKESVELYEKFLALESSGSSVEYARQRIEKLKRLAY